MDSDKTLIKTAIKLVELMDKTADQSLPTEIANVVKLHSKLAVGSAWIPIPGADMAAGAANIWGMYAIPIAFYMPSRIPASRCDELAQQIDLNLSILSSLGVNDTVFSFGRNLFDTLDNPAFVTYINQTYQYSDGHYLVQSDGNTTFGVFNIQNDKMLDNNLVSHIQCNDLAKMLKERIQEYNNRMIFNQLYIDKAALHEQEKDTLYYQSDFGEEPQRPTAGID